MSDLAKVLGVDVGGTKIAVCIADTEGNVLANGRVPTGGAPYEEVIAKVIALAKELVAGQGLSMGDLSCIGICAPGPLDMERGLITRSPNLVWENAPIRDDLANGLGLKAILENDANAGVLAEVFFGTAKGKKDVVYVTMSTGVGTGVLTGGHLVTGAMGIGAEMGHLVLEPGGPMCGCGLSGCLEAYCGGRNVALRIQEKLRNHPESPMYKLPGVDGKVENLNFQAVREGAKQGIPVAVEMWDEICCRLAQGIGIMMVTFNPEMVVLGTAAYYAGDFMLDRVKHYLPMFTWPEFIDCCQLVITTLGPKVGELAGAAVGLNAIK